MGSRSMPVRESPAISLIGTLGSGLR
ncbi:MAG: hypothetical protein JWN16_2303, partial [Alphaproteobacteria bacterium]|nr:hypothetical protein [Alphaproteobacteria bacterium]